MADLRRRTFVFGALVGAAAAGAVEPSARRDRPVPSETVPPLAAPRGMQ